MTPTALEERYLTDIDRRLPELEGLLREIVETNSFTRNADGVNKVGVRLTRELEGLGFRVSELVAHGLGRTLVARREGAEGPRLLLLGHLDTVHPPGPSSSTLTPAAEFPERLLGPGALDMKGGLVVLVGALSALHREGRLERRSVTVVLGSDEEIGSPSSGDLIKAEALDSGLCLCFEGGRPAPGGASTFVTSRRGFGRFILRAKGRAAHAGVDPRAGGSAVLELAQKVIDLAALADPEAGIDVNVGIFRGGTAANTIPEDAEIAVDYRFPDEDAKIELEDALMAVAGRNVVRDAAGRALVATRIHDHTSRPPLERTEAVARMAERLVRWGRELGQELVEESRGGSSDAALAAEVGCPALCGLGVVGEGFHTEGEWYLAASLGQRTRLAALTIDRFFALGEKS